MTKHSPLQGKSEQLYPLWRSPDMTEHSPLQGKTPDRAGYGTEAAAIQVMSFFIGASLDRVHSTS